MRIVGEGGFHVDGVEVADTRWRRFRGLMGRDPIPMLIETASVHGFWLRDDLSVVGVSSDLIVTGTRLLQRRRLLRMRGARWVLELPLGLRLPAPGERLAFSEGDGEAWGHGGSPLHLRHTDRQPG